VRARGLAETMSDYLVQRIAATPRVTLLTETEITGLDGERMLETVTWTNHANGDCQCKPIRNVFVMIGAAPNTDWLKDCLALDPKGFVLTGPAGATRQDGVDIGSVFATSREGVFAVGDVRSGSVKRVASGVGEGSVVVQAIHRFLHPPLA